MAKLIGFIAIVLAILYLAWPIDIIPDLIPIVGWIDDVFAVLVAIFLFIKT